MGRLVQPLFDGPLDVVGDVHGELDALCSLLARLGYDTDGRHHRDRRLVFVGDLCDRGPDSPGVIRLVQGLVESGRAQLVAGNHELNLLRGERKHGNHWFYGHTYDAAHPEFGQCAALFKSARAPTLAFLRSLPVALERPDLRVVHAAWVDEAIDRCRAIDRTLDVAYLDFDSELRETATFKALEADRAAEEARLGPALRDPDAAPSSAVLGAYDECHQMGNPIRVITSGIERETQRPFHAAGKWRWVNRVAWWRNYAGEVPVLFGHYWRWHDPASHQELSSGEPHLFFDDPVGPAMAVDHQAFCIDFSVGSRYRQRGAGQEGPFHGRLAAMRWPERELVYDDSR